MQDCLWIAPICSAIDWWQQVPEGIRDWIVADFPSWLAVVLAMTAWLALRRPVTQILPTYDRWQACRENGRVRIVVWIQFIPVARGFMVTSLELKTSWERRVYHANSQELNRLQQHAMSQFYNFNVPDTGREEMQVEVNVRLADGSHKTLKHMLPVTACH